MPELDDVASGEAIESAWGNAIRDRTIQRYTSAAQRDSLHPAPVEGDLAYLADVNQIQYYDGSTWRVMSSDQPVFSRGDASSVGTVGTAYRGVDETGVDEGTLDGSAVAVTVDTNRSLALVRVQAQSVSPSAQSTFAISYRISGATTLAAGDARAAVVTTDGRIPLFTETLQAITPGSNTFHVQIKSTSGAITWTLRFPAITVHPV